MTDPIILPTTAAVEMFAVLAEAMRPDPAWAADVDRRCAELAAERADRLPPSPEVQADEDPLE